MGLDETAKEFLKLGEDIDRLNKKRDELKAELADNLSHGDTILYNGQVYQWEEYYRTTTPWKQIFSQALPMLDDESSVIVGETQRKLTKKSGPFYKFARK